MVRLAQLGTGTGGIGLGGAQVVGNGTGVAGPGRDLTREDAHQEAVPAVHAPVELGTEERDMLGEVKQALAEAATIYFTAVPPAEVTGPIPSPPAGGTLRLEDVAVRLGVGAGHLSDLLSAYPELFGMELADGGRITESGFLKAAALFRMTRDGLARREILRRMALVAQETEVAATRDPARANLATHLGQLVSDLQRSEIRRTEERDRFVTALMRTRQEIQHLRYELAAAIPRRQRKRGSFLAWLKD